MPSTQPMDEKIPGGISSTYDPLNPTPYSPPAGSGAGDLPSVAPPPPPQRPQSDTQQPAAPSVAPGKKGGTLAPIAFMGDSILRGFIRGREQAQQMQAYKAQKLANGLSYAYKSASQHYLELLKSGADPNSKEVKDAEDGANAAWQSYMQMIGNQMGQGKSKGKGKGKGADSSQPENPQELLASKDPKDQARGWYLIALKAGPTFKYQATQYQTPEYRKQLELAKGAQNVAGTEQQLAGDIAKSKVRWQQLMNMDQSKMDADTKAEFERLNKNPEINPLASKLDKKTGQYVGADNKLHTQWQRADGSTYESVGESEERTPVSQSVGSLPDFIKRVAKESGVDEKDLTAESTQALRKAFAASKTNDKVTSQNYIYTDKETGQLVVVPLTRTSTGGSSAVPKVHGESGVSGAATATSSSSSSSAKPKNPGRVRDLPSIDGSKPSTAATAGTAASTNDPSITPPPGSPPGARVIGHTLSQPNAKAIQTTTTTYQKMKPLFGLLGAQEDYMKEVRSDPSKASPRQDLSMVVAAVRAMNPGSVRLPQAELELELKAGSWGDQAARWYEKASTGLLPNDQREDLFKIIERETTKAGQSIAKDWQQYMKDQPLPDDIQRFAKAGGAGSGDASRPHAVDKILDDIMKPAPAPASQ